MIWIKVQPILRPLAGDREPPGTRSGWSRFAFALACIAVATTAAVTMASCGSSPAPTAATQTGPIAPVAATKGTSSPSSPTPSRPSSGKGASDLATFPPAAAGGSAIEFTTPCDSGTVTLNAHGDGAGVTATGTLSHVADTKWLSDMTVTPFVAPDGPPTLATRIAHHGALVITATNLKGPGAGRAGVNYAWPQDVSMQLMGKTYGNNCSEDVYLSSTRVAVDTGQAAVNVAQAAGTIKVYNGDVTRGTWRVTVEARTPTGVQRKTVDAAAKYLLYGGVPVHQLNVTFSRFTDLSDFTTINVTIAKTDGSHRTWMRVTRTP